MSLSGLSGRVDSAEASITNIQQDLLQKIDIATQSSFSSVINQQIDTLTALVNNLDTRYRALQGLYQNLVAQESNRWSYFTGYTGEHTAAFTGYSGYMDQLFTGHTGNTGAHSY